MGGSDLTRVIARVLDGLRPAPSDPRGRPLQQFVAADHVARVGGDAATVTVEASSAATYDVTKYGRGLYQ